MGARPPGADVAPRPGSPAPPSSRSRLAGVLVFVLLLAAVALPAGFSALAALLSFSGSSLYADGESQPEVAAGLGWTAVALLLLALPVVLGLTVARVRWLPEHRRRNTGWAVVVLVLFVAGSAYLSRVV